VDNVIQWTSWNLENVLKAAETKSAWTQTWATEPKPQKFSRKTFEPKPSRILVEPKPQKF